jgi:hypothetical protein
MLELKLNTPDTAQINTKTDDFVGIAEAMVIDSPEMLDFANGELEKVKAQIKALDAQHGELKSPVLELGRKIDGMFFPAIRTLQTVEKTYKGKIGPYILEQQRIAQEEQRRRDAEAERERRRVQKEAAAAERQAAEQRRQAEAEAAARRKQAEDEAEAQREEVLKLVQAGDTEGAERVVEDADRAVQDARALEDRQRQEAADTQTQQNTQVAVTRLASRVIAAAPVAAVVKPSNISARAVYKAEGVDLAATVKAAAAGDATAMACLAFDTKKIGQLVKSLEDNFKVPGVLVRTEAAVSQRSARAA